MENKKNIIAIILAVLITIIIVIAVFIGIKNNKKYTVTFDTQGGNTIESITVKTNEQLILPENPTKEGYIFLQWVDEKNNVIVNKTKIIKDMKLIAKWAEEKQEVIKISFDTDGGSKIEDILLVKGEKLKFPDNPTKKGYIFKNWVDKDKKTINQDAMFSEDTILKAIWEKEKEKKEEIKQPVETKPQEEVKQPVETKPQEEVKQPVETKPQEEVKQPVETKPQEEVKQPVETKPQEEQKPEETPKIEVTNIALNKSLLELVIGKTATLTPTIVPNNATDKSVQWTSSDSNIISVDNLGKVTAKAIGSATITAKTSNGKTATAKVTSDVKSITLVPSNLNISKYGTITSTTITAKIDANGYEIPDNLIIWSAPDASGQNAPAYMSISGKTVTINARDVWGSTVSSVPVTVKINNKQVKTTIYVEPKISVSNLSNGVTGSENNGRLMLTFKGEKSLYLQSNLDVTWDYNVNSSVVAGIEQSNNRNLRLSVQYVSQNGLNIKARSKAGQVKEIVLTPTL